MAGLASGRGWFALPTAWPDMTRKDEQQRPASASPKKSSRRRRILLIWLSALVLGCAALLLYAATHPETLHPRRLMRFARSTDLGKVVFCACRPDREVSIQRPDGLRLSGGLFGSQSSAQRPGVLLLHGHTPLGRDLALYRVLGAELAERGFLVLAIDFSGFGESDDPFSSEDTGLFDGDADARVALDYLAGLGNVDPARILIIGHSRGGTEAVTVGLERPEVRGIVAFGPTRRLTERLGREKNRKAFWDRIVKTRERVYGKPFPHWYTEQMYLDQLATRDISRFIPQLSARGHKPILLLDGEAEEPRDLHYLRAFFDTIGEPKRYHTLRGADHYGRTVNLGGYVLYDRAVIDEVVDQIERWSAEIW